MSSRHHPVFALFAAVLALCSCTSGDRVRLEAINNPGVKPDAISYEIKPGSPDLDADSLRFKEAAGFVKTALSAKGMYEAPPGAVPDMVVSIDYGLGPPVPHQEKFISPVYQRVDGGYEEVTVKVGVTADGKPIYQTVTVPLPPIMVHVSDEVTEVTVVTYEKHLRVAAREGLSGQGKDTVPADIWSIDVTSDGESHDLRKALPVLSAATIDYIGKDTRGEKAVKITEKNPDVAFIKKGM